ncbi:hypothetical protein ACIBUY_40365 [Streptomyces sp. NPDC050085]|uniref:hypothetical protein n=1 Tax=Streptomyces sp. NPDC050085 TaxID=3365600 RepID=UPI003796228A
MRFKRSAAITFGIAAAVSLGFGPQAQASQNSGWVYTSTRSGNVYFDADLNGQPGIEKVTVCDNKSDGRGIEVHLTRDDASSVLYLRDPSNDGHCVSLSGNFYKEESYVRIHVYEYWGNNEANIGEGSAIA